MSQSPCVTEEGVDEMPQVVHTGFMRPLDIQVVGEELAIKWEDGSECFIPLEKLRLCCPCAGCQGERDVLGHLHKGPEQPLSSSSFRIVRVERIGGYAVQPVWADGHHTGLYGFDHLRRVAESQEDPPRG